ncbi:MAG TPA: MAPEG family protein [Oxalicibacterium sp.]|nr:MAPEG family protein [Oxalicibacterium sp.]
MTLAYWSILVAGLLPAATIAIAKFGAKDFDNAAPRDWLDKQQGMRGRADAAHRNHFEAFPFFAAGILVAELCHVPQDRVDTLAAAFIVLRVIYTGLYLANLATLRSLCWALGYLCVIALFVLSGLQG